MSGLQARTEEPINGVDVREQGSALRSVFTFVSYIKLVLTVVRGSGINYGLNSCKSLMSINY